MDEIKEVSPHGDEKVTNAFVADCGDKWIVEFISEELTVSNPTLKRQSTSKILRFLIHNALIAYLGQEEYDRLRKQYQNTQIAAEEKISEVLKGE